MILLYIVVGLLMGIVFGVALEKGRVFEPGMIVGQFQLRNFTMLKMFLSAAATGLVAIGVLQATGVVRLHPKAALYPATIIGGAIFGAGMALSGACPGTVLAQIGAGYRDAWAVVAGGILGAMSYGYLDSALSPLNKGPGKITLSDVLGVPFLPLALIAAAVIAVFLFLLERCRPWRSDMGRDFDGLMS